MPWFFPSFLTPTFFVLGLIAISLPILFHFFRRTPKGNVQFSTLMFLKPSPPRLTRRSRVDNWLLLILRGLALLFIALAFGRVFFRQADFLNLADLPSRRIAVLVDTSASMMRNDLWDQARQEFSDVLQDLGPKDEIALFTFNSSLQTVVGFSTSETAKMEAKKELIRKSMETLNPEWKETDLGQALIDVVDQIQGDQESDSKDVISESQIIVITDFQQGSDIRSLQSFEWPQDIPVDVRAVGDDTSDNATLSLIQDNKGISTDYAMRVKVSNAEGSQVSQFEINWLADKQTETEWAGTIVVPPGQSRTLNLKAPDFEFEGLELTGDKDDFDNRFYIAYPKVIPEKIMFVGGDDDVRNQLLFYLKKACSTLLGSRLEFLDRTEFKESDMAGDSGPNIVFVTGVIDETEAARIRKFNEAGGLVCIVVTGPEMQANVQELVGGTVSISKPGDEDYSLLGEIDFRHKLFSPFADPKYSNFSNIRFWKHREVSSDELNALAKFDNSHLAIGNRSVGKGELYVMTSGWHPADSQLALSTKFVGIMMSMMLKKLTRENRNLELGETVKLSQFVTESECVLTRPDGNDVKLGDLSEVRVLDEVDSPGIYQLSTGTESKRIAFNLPASESRTSRLPLELLEQENIQLGTMNTASETVEIERQRKDTELESSQKLWRWMLLIALALLFSETLLSSYFSRRQVQGALTHAENNSASQEG